MHFSQSLAAAAAASNTIAGSPIYKALRDQIVIPIIYLAFAVALILFIWGIISYLVALRQGDLEKKTKGQQHMIWGAIGMAIMISVFGIMQFILATLLSLPGGNTGFNGQQPFIPPETGGL